MKIGIVQFAPVWENPIDSFLKVKELISKSNVKADLLIFPEMSLTGFTMLAEKFSEEFDGFATQSFLRMAQSSKTNIMCGVIEKHGKEIYNSLIHFDTNGLLKARYRKIHPFSHAEEDKYYLASDEIVVTEIDHHKIGLTICYDLRFPELYRLNVKQGAEILINIANWPITRIEHWKTLLKARAIENQAYMIGVNRTGIDTKYEYNGCSSIFDPMGKQIAMIENEEGVFYFNIDLNLVKETRTALPFLDDIKLI